MAMASSRAMGCRGLRMYETLTLIKRSRLTPSSLFASVSSSAAVPPPLIGIVISARPYSSSQLAEDQDNVFDEDSSSSSSSPSTSRSLDNLEKAIHNVMVKRCAPDWLPFKPGSSYWAPPLSQHHHRARKFLQLLATFAHSLPLSDSDDYDGEALSISTVRGWPSSSYFIQGTSSPHPLPSEVKVELKVNKNSENAPQTNDEEE